MSKIFILGLDGATMDVMMPMIEQGQLPAFEKVMAKGAWGRLKSVVPPLSPPAWTSFATGKNPGKHGIIGFTRLIPNSYSLRLVSGRDNKSLTLWELLSAAGKRVIVVNVPMTYPPKPVNGILISGLDTPDVRSDFTYPPEIKDEIFSHVPEYRINLQLGGYLQNDKRRATGLEMIHRDIESRYRAVEYLMDQYPWDAFIVKFNNPDIVQHHFWKYMDLMHPDHDPKCPADFKQAIPNVYKQLDRVAASLMEKLDEDTTFMVMSDHGGGARANKVVYVNQCLMENGFLRRSDSGSKGRRDLKESLIRSCARHLNRPLSFLFRHTSPNLRIRLKNMMPGVFGRLSLHFKFSGWMAGIDWSKTTAFLAEQECVRINLAGSYPEGMVDPKDYARIRDQVMDKLRGIQDPWTGESVFSAVRSREEAFGVSDDMTFPDIQMVTREAKYDISGKLDTEMSLPQGTYVGVEKNARAANGMHRPEGIFFLSGPGCKPNSDVSGATLTDLCPTILFSLGIPVPTDLDGRIIDEAFEEDFLSRQPVEYSEREEQGQAREESDMVYSSDEEAMLIDNLKSLGYMD